MAVAVRIARAHTGKDTIAFCGYHGWHDWYLSANLADDKNLDGQLLPGLEPKGVPRALKGTSIPFNYNKLQELEQIVEDNDIGVIVMEPVHSYEPKPGFLEGVRKIADQNDIVLVFDEITIGWRMRVGGVHMNYNVIPDIAVYAKTMSNGYPMAAIVGKADVMESAQKTFISSTYWTDGVGLVASLATIEKCINKNVPDHVNAIGKQVKRGWEKISNEYSVPLKIEGLPPIASLKFATDNSQAVLTLFTQEMLKRGFLATNIIYSTYSHTSRDVEEYLSNVEDVFEIIQQGIENKTIESHLEGPVAHEGFKRLN
jgi:glutamate-1-semialdehyde aminotransferase